MLSERPDAMLKIHRCDFERAVFPWRVERLMTPYWRFYWNRGPGGFIRQGEAETELRPEFFHIVPGYLEFSTFATMPFDQFYIHFNLSDRLPPPREIVRLPADPAALDWIRRFIEAGGEEEFAQLRMLAGLAVLSATLLRLPPEMLRLPHRPDLRIDEVRRWMERHPKEHLANDELARKLRMHRNHFIRLFRSETGESPQFFWRRKRVELACELLHFSNRSIEEIAEATGFADRYHFSRVFAKVIRTTPAAFRRGARGGVGNDGGAPWTAPWND